VPFGIEPTYLFLLRHRLLVGRLREGWRPWISTQATNAAIAVVAMALISMIGVRRFCWFTCPR
jgi:omega-6 fatty acid desaturase (delta-12 desaturase)